MNTPLLCRIEKKQYYLNGTAVDQDFSLIERAQFFEHVTVKEDIYPDYSIIYKFENPVDHPVIAIVGQQKVKLHRGVTFYVAPRCFVKWVYPKGVSVWKSYLYGCKDAKDLVKECALFPMFDTVDLCSASQYVNILDRTKLITLPALYKKDATRILGDYLLNNFCEDVDILEVYKELGIASSTAAYLFKKTYGVSPLCFRNRLRVFKALRLISLGDEVQSISKKVGFSSYSSFYRQFSSTLNTTPSDFIRPSHRLNAA